jgi:hypothetical protein
LTSTIFNLTLGIAGNVAIFAVVEVVAAGNVAIIVGGPKKPVGAGELVGSCAVVVARRQLIII